MLNTRLRTYLKKNLSLKRYRHSESAGETARKLCRMYNIPEDKGLIVGLGHDIAREMEPSRLLELASSMFTLEKWELKRSKMLHGKAGAVILAKHFNITDREILEAVAWHTTGFPGMGDLAKIVYIADYIEPNRKHGTREIRKKIELCSLDDAFIFILKKKQEYLKKAGKQLMPPTKALCDALQCQRSRS